MPSYTFTCQKCQQQFTLETTIEERQREDSRVFRCPRCQSTQLLQDPQQKLYTAGVGSGEKSSACAGCSQGQCTNCSF